MAIPFNGSGGTHPGCEQPLASDETNTATLLYQMDAGEDTFIVLDYSNNDDSGKRDLKVFVPDALFNQDSSCDHQGEGCTVYVNLVSRFGEDFDVTVPPLSLLGMPHTNNDGYEEWGVRVVKPTAVTLKQVDIGSSDLTMASPLAITVGLLIIATVVVIWRLRSIKV